MRILKVFLFAVLLALALIASSWFTTSVLGIREDFPSSQVGLILFFVAFVMLLVAYVLWATGRNYVFSGMRLSREPLWETNRPQFVALVLILVLGLLFGTAIPILISR